MTAFLEGLIKRGNMTAFANCEDNHINGADVAMMMFTTSFVMLQTPAMGIAQAGMIRRKNSLSMLMQTLSGSFASFA